LNAAARCIATGARTSVAGDSHAQAFTQKHLRLAKSLAIPAAVAIQNARLYEQAEIFRAELEPRLIDLEQTERALKEVRQGSQCPHG
jgi:GAF domain-containing protein